MKERTPRRTTRAVRETAEKELTELLPAIETATADAESKESQMKRSADRARVEKASTSTVDGVTREIADLQVSVGRVLTSLSQQLREESGKLVELRLAIEVETARLKEMHEIDAAMVSLKAILEVAAERRATLEAELRQQEEDLRASMEGRRAAWKQEQADFEGSTKKAREREEDEYAYKLALKRRKEADEYASQHAAAVKADKEDRATAEREIEARMQAVAAREAEINELKARTERFPQELAAAVKQAEQAARTEAQKQAALDAKLARMEMDSERSLTTLKIAGLEETIKRQTSQMEALTKQLTLAQGQVQAMAVKAIEGAAGSKASAAQ